MSTNFSCDNNETPFKIRTERKCVIKNKDPKKIQDINSIISYSLNKGQTINKSKLSSTQYKLLEALASANDCDIDDDIDILTLRDLEQAYKRLNTTTDVFREIGVRELRYDANAGVINITAKDGEVLRVEFGLNLVSVKKTEPQQNSSIQKDNKTASAKKSQVAVPKHDVVKPNANVASIISKFKGGNISIDQVHDMKSVARYTGISERYIRDILVGIEGKNNWPLTKAEYDGVADKKHPKGYLTIGFGHTSLTGEPIVYEGMVISSKQAYQILANDIMTAKKYAKYYGGDAYNNAPNSIKNAMIDLVFNKGPGAINENLKANLNKGYFHSAALRTWYITNNVGLQKRNIYRFIEACKNLTTNERRNAISRFRNEHLLAMQNVFKKDNNSLVEWNSFCIVSKCKEYHF